MKNSLCVLLIAAGLVSGLMLFPASVTRAEAKTKLSVTIKAASQKVNKNNHHEKGQQQT